MARQRAGSVQKRNDGSIWARVTYVSDDGKRHELRRRAETRTQAKEIIKRLLRELDDVGPQSFDGDHMRFKDLARIYQEAKIIPPEYHGERKVAGLRSWQSARGFLKVLVDTFGNKPLKSITHATIEQFLRQRLTEPTTRGGQRSIASANRELELLRAMLRYAQRQGWIPRSPFESGAPVISKADEARRERTLSHDEEVRLLAACTGKRAHLRFLLIVALDTAMRRGELFKLRWRDVDLNSRTIKIKAMNSKTARERTVAMTHRVQAELTALKAGAPFGDSGLVFGIHDTVKKSFAAACKEAGISDFRFHDARHMAITRMVQAGIPPTEIMKISGHTQFVTFAQYVNPSGDSVRRAADLLGTFNAVAGTKEVTKGLVLCNFSFQTSPSHNGAPTFLSLERLRTATGL